MRANWNIAVTTCTTIAVKNGHNAPRTAALIVVRGLLLCRKLRTDKKTGWSARVVSLARASYESAWSS